MPGTASNDLRASDMKIHKSISVLELKHAAAVAVCTVTTAAKLSRYYYAYLHKPDGTKPCWADIATVAYCILKTANLNGSAVNKTLVQIGTLKFTTQSGAIATLLKNSGKYSCAHPSHDIAGIVAIANEYAKTQKLAAQSWTKVSGTWNTPLVPPKPVQPKKLTKVGYMQIDAQPINADALTGGVKTPGYSTKRDLQSAVMVFYMLEEACFERPDFAERRAFYLADLARTMFDYLAGIAWDEARHAKGAKWQCNGKSCGCGHVNHDPRQFLPVMKQLFNENCWDGSFGGRPWARIAEAAIMYFTSPPGAFFDHCVDLSHHGGLAFDKGFIWSPPNGGDYATMLDQKRDATVLFSAANVLGHGLRIDPAELKWFMWVTGLSDEIGPAYKRTAWGDRLVEVSLSRDYMEGDDDEEDESEEREERERTIKPEAPTVIWERIEGTSASPA